MTMPNWCYNAIEITGSKDKVKAIWDRASGDNEGGLLDALVPMPSELVPTLDGKALEEPIDGYTHWYDWRLMRWGVKWDVEPDGLIYAEDGDTATISGYLESAWSPPLEAFMAYSEANPDVHLEVLYHEEGMDFAGLWRSNGEQAHIDCTHDMIEPFKAGELGALESEIMDVFDIVENAELDAEWENQND